MKKKKAKKKRDAPAAVHVEANPVMQVHVHPSVSASNEADQALGKLMGAKRY